MTYDLPLTYELPPVVDKAQAAAFLLALQKKARMLPHPRRVSSTRKLRTPRVWQHNELGTVVQLCPRTSLRRAARGTRWRQQRHRSNSLFYRAALDSSYAAKQLRDAGWRRIPWRTFRRSSTATS